MYDYNGPLEQMLFCFNASQNLEPDRIDDKCDILLKIFLLHKRYSSLTKLDIIQI